MDRASDFGSDGWEFESLRAHLVVSLSVQFSFDAFGARNLCHPVVFATRSLKVPLSQIFLTSVKAYVNEFSQEEKWRDVQLVRPKFGWLSDYL